MYCKFSIAKWILKSIKWKLMEYFLRCKRHTFESFIIHEKIPETKSFPRLLEFGEKRLYVETSQ